MRLDVRLEATARPRQTVLLGGPHNHQLLATPEQGAQLLRLGVRQRARRRTNHVGNMCQRAGIQRIRLGQLPRSTRTIARLPRVHHHDGQARRGQRRRGDPLQAAGGFQHKQGGVEGLQPFYERHNAIGIVRHGPTLPRGAQRNIELGFRHINAHKAWRITHEELLSARPCLYGLRGTRQLYGLEEART